MNQRDKIDTLKLEIQQKQSEIASLMIETIKKYGGEIETTEGRKYKAIENSGINFLIEKFGVEDDRLIITGDFDGEKCELDIEGLYITELSEAMFMILDDKSRIVQQRITTLTDKFTNQYSDEPLYASCKIMYLDSHGDECDVTIKLASDLDVADDEIHYYCNSLNDLKHLTVEGCEEFIVTDVYELNSEL